MDTYNHCMSQSVVKTRLARRRPLESHTILPGQNYQKLVALGVLLVLLSDSYTLHCYYIRPESWDSARHPLLQSGLYCNRLECKVI